MSYTYVIGRQCEEMAVGKKWTFQKFTRKVWADLAVEARRLMPDPIAVLGTEAYEKLVLSDAETIRKMTIADEAEKVAAKAEKRKPILMAPQYQGASKAIEERAYLSKSRYLSAGSPELSGFLLSNEGQSYLFYLLLKTAHPDITPDDAYDVYWDLASNAGSDGRKTPDEIINICNGRSAEPSKNGESPA